MDRFGKRYTGIAGFRILDDGLAEVVGMVKRGKFNRSSYEEIIREFDKIGKKVKYDRRDESGNLKRSVTMGKHNLPSVRDAVKNGKLDKHQAKKDLAKVMKAVDDGLVSINIGDQIDGSGDTAAIDALNAAVAALKDGDVLVWFVRSEN